MLCKNAGAFKTKKAEGERPKRRRAACAQRVRLRASCPHAAATTRLPAHPEVSKDRAEPPCPLQPARQSGTGDRRTLTERRRCGVPRRAFGARFKPPARMPPSAKAGRRIDCPLCDHAATARAVYSSLKSHRLFEACSCPVRQRRDRIMVSPNSQVAGKESSHGQCS